MFSWFKRTPAVTPPPLRPVAGTFNGMTLSDWRTSDPHIRWMREQMTQPYFRDMLAVLSNLRCAPAQPGTTPTDAAILLGIRQGHDHLLGTLLDLANFPDITTTDVPITYRDDEYDINKLP